MVPAVTLEALLAEVIALRAELAATKTQLTAVNAENVALRAEVAKLRAQINQSSSNSSRPPSSDPPWHVKRKPPKRPSGRKPGGQPGHKPHRRERLEPTEEFDVHAPECFHCGGSLGNETVIGEAPHVHQVVDIEIRPVVKDFHLLVHQCPACRGRTQASIPLGVPKGCIGPRLQATVALLAGRYRLSRTAVHQIVQDLFGVRVSVGTVQNTCERVSDAIATPVAQVLDAVRSTPERRQLCHAHLRRDIQALIDRGGAAEVVGKALLTQNDAMFSLWHAFGRGELGRPALIEAMIPVQQRTRALLENGLTHTDHKVKVLSKDLVRLWPSLWVFVANDDVDPINNVAERTLRPAVLLRKCNGGTRSAAGANFTEGMLTASATASRQEIGLFAWLCQATEAAESYTSPPGLLVAAVGSG